MPAPVELPMSNQGLLRTEHLGCQTSLSQGQASNNTQASSVQEWGNSSMNSSGPEEGQNTWGWGSWDTGRSTPPPPGALLNSPLNHLCSDFDRAALSWNGVPDCPAHLDDIPTEIWAQAQLFCCSERTQQTNSEFPTFTGPQIESRIEVLEQDIWHTQIMQEIFQMEAGVALVHYHDMKRAEHEEEEKLQKLRKTEKELADLHLIAHTMFAPSSV